VSNQVGGVLLLFWASHISKSLKLYNFATGVLEWAFPETTTTLDLFASLSAIFGSLQT
jgi:hypothetical protein